MEDDALPHKRRLIQITRQLIQQYDDKEFDEYLQQIIYTHSSQLMQNYQLSNNEALAKQVCCTVFKVIRLGMQIVDVNGSPQVSKDI